MGLLSNRSQRISIWGKSIKHSRARGCEKTRGNMESIFLSNRELGSQSDYSNCDRAQVDLY